MLSHEQFSALPAPQREAVEKVYAHWFEGAEVPHEIRTFDQYLEWIHYDSLMGCVMVECPCVWGTLWLGVEQDGYTHS